LPSEPSPHTELELLIGAASDVSGRELEVAWASVGHRLMEEHAQVGWRPWGWWVFEAGEDQPPDKESEAVRLAELAVLTADEVAALAERANEARMGHGTPRERISDGDSVDLAAVELFEAVERALGPHGLRRPAGRC